MDKNRIPAFELRGAVDAVRAEVEEGWRSLLDQTAFVGGHEVSRFEDAFSDYLGAPACAGVANGTDALVLSLKALGVGPGDEVIVPAFSFAASATTVAWLGGRPVFADVEPHTLNLDPRDLGNRVTERTVGVIGVHLYGRPFDQAVRAFCDRKGLWLIEDAAQAHGASLASRRVGAVGELATWSFYPTKNLGCFGDGGAVTGCSAELVETVRRLRNHGQQGRYRHVELGTNSRLDALQAAVLNRRLPRLEGANERRRQIAASYSEALGPIAGLTLLADPPGSIPVYHQMTILTERRDELASYLETRGVGTSIHYPEPLHHQPALEAFAPGDDELPVSIRAARQVLCLPMFPELTDDQVAIVCSRISDFFASSG
ncbi:MAG: DegT/DnrJ/EryC1/StrS family aminotransferase [Acidobacteriota bacterium]|nr:DegT/DnrJ/EryC1/StrS family aminotransferase [Acidobacteriota bacterium]